MWGKKRMWPKKFNSKLKCWWFCTNQCTLKKLIWMVCKPMISITIFSKIAKMRWSSKFRISSRNGANCWELLKWKLLIRCTITSAPSRKNSFNQSILINEWLMTPKDGWTRPNTNLMSMPKKLWRTLSSSRMTCLTPINRMICWHQANKFLIKTKKINIFLPSKA